MAAPDLLEPSLYQEAHFDMGANRRLYKIVLPSLNLFFCIAPAIIQSGLVAKAWHYRMARLVDKKMNVSTSSRNTAAFHLGSLQPVQSFMY